MKYINKISCSRIIFLFVISFQTITICQIKQVNRYSGQTIEEIIQLPEDSIDLGIACLALAKDAYPTLDINFFDYAIDYMAERINYLMQENTKPEARVGMMNTYFFKSGWWNDSITFTYDLEDLEAKQTINQFLNGYIASKKGSCATMSMLYLVIADRLNWPIKPVRSPKHIFCRYIKKGLRENNIEATNGGGYLADEDYIEQVGIPKKAIKNGVYLRTLTKKEYIATLMMSNVRYFAEERKDLNKAIYYCKLALSLDKTLASAYWNLGQLYSDSAYYLDTARVMAIREIDALYRIEETNDQNRQEILPPKQSTTQHLMTMEERIENMKPKAPKPGEPFIKHQQPVVSQDILLANRQTQREAEIEDTHQRYMQRFNILINEGKGLKKKAKEMGIVLKFPEEFFIKQAESIEKFKRTGKY